MTEEADGYGVEAKPPSALVHAPLSPSDLRDARRADGGGLELTCAASDNDCAPRMIAVAASGIFASASEVDFNSLVANQGAKHNVVVTFAGPTSAPPLLRKEDVDRCVVV